MTTRSKSNDASDIRWTWIGKGERVQGTRKLKYNAVECLRKSDGWKRTFKCSDAVYVAGGEGEEPWVAHLVELFDSRNFPDERMRCTLRWFYGANDIPKLKTPLNVHPEVRELYFSDHVESCESHSSSVDAIEGRAFLCPTVLDVDDVKRRQGVNDYCEDDVVCLVRFFYYSETKNLVRLKQGELKSLLKEPSTDTLHDVIAPRRRIDMDSSDDEPAKPSPQVRPASDWVLKTITDSAKKRRKLTLADIGDVPSPLPSSEIKRQKRTGSISKRDGDGKGSKRRLPRGTIRHPIDFDSLESDDNEQTASARMRPETMSRAKLRTSKRKPPEKAVKKKDSRTRKTASRAMEVDTGTDDEPNAEPSAMEVAWKKFKDDLKSLPPDFPLFTKDTIEEMYKLSTGAMTERNLDFDMGERDKRNVARVVAEQMFGNWATARGSVGASSSSDS